MSQAQIQESQANNKGFETYLKTSDNNFLNTQANEMPSSIFNSGKTDYSTAPLFFGQEQGLLDTIHTNYPKLMEFHMELKGMDWKHNEFDYRPCIEQFKTCRPSIAVKMIKTIGSQWAGDSIAAATVAEVLLPVCSATELRVGYMRIADNENLHAMTYSQIVRGSFENPSEVLNTITQMRETFGRMSAIAKGMGRAEKAIAQFKAGVIPYSQELYEIVFVFLVFLYFLERIQFMSSFAVTALICASGLFEPINAAVQLIARDEYTNHVPFGEEVLRIEMNTVRGALAFKNNRQLILDGLVEVIMTERNWNAALFSDGEEFTGGSEKRLNDYSAFCALPAIAMFGFENDIRALGIDIPTSNPIGMMDEWIDINKKQSSPQEQDHNGYVTDPVSARPTNSVYPFFGKRLGSKPAPTANNDFSGIPVNVAVGSIASIIGADS